MHVPSPHIKRIARIVAVCLLWWMMAAPCCLAQSPTRLPDSIPGSAENTPVIDTTVSTIDSVGTARDTADGQKDQSAGSDHADSVTFRAVPDSVMARLKKDKDFAYANDPAYWTRKKENKSNGSNGFLRSLAQLLSSRGFKYFIYCLLAAILFYALYKIIAENNLRLFYRPGAKGTMDNGQRIPAEEEDWEKGLAQALAASDHRLATRYLYLTTLRLLDTKELIRYHPETTNHEYMRQLDALPQGAGFRFLTGAYERVWYGGFAIDEQQFARLFQYFKDFQKTLSAT